jgi:hypothetical protein
MIAASRFKYGRGVDQVRLTERHLKDPNLSKMIYRVEVERNVVLRALVNDGRLTEEETGKPKLVEQQLARIIADWVVAVNKGR